MSFKTADKLFHFLAWLCFMFLFLKWAPKDWPGCMEFAGVFFLYALLEYMGDLARLQAQGRLK